MGGPCVVCVGDTIQRAPCACTGTVGWVHWECLLNVRLMMCRDTCPTCRMAYPSLRAHERLAAFVLRGPTYKLAAVFILLTVSFTATTIVAIYLTTSAPPLTVTAVALATALIFMSCVVGLILTFMFYVSYAFRF